MKNNFLLLALAIFSLTVNSQNYRYSVDIANVIDDKITVELHDISWTEDIAKFNFPKTIPGTYATQNYGVYIEGFKAYDKKGNELSFEKSTENTYVISDAKTLSRISYLVNDSWDSDVKKDKIFEPAGTNWEEGKNFVFNNSGVFGFFEDKELWPFNIDVKKPKELFGLTVLETKASGTLQTFKAKDYHQLVDCPILFSKPDTAQFKVSNTNVTIGVFSQYEGEFAHKIYDELKESMSAIDKFVGELPVDNYSFLIYLADQTELGKDLAEGVSVGTIAKLAKMGGVGALEHGNSSFYYLVYLGEQEINGPLGRVNYIEILKDVAIHEFMHIFTPLNLHSEHIGNFDYIDPKMSKHLWLYEGITEYFSGLIQLQAGITPMEDYFNKTMKEKMQFAARFPHDKMSFTEMSENILDKSYAKQYMQVYQRGAIMGLLLDIEIARLTNGEKTLKDVIITLGKRYGPEKSFNDDEFIKEFVAEVHPDLQQHFDKYVSGKEKLPLNAYLDRIGVKYYKEKYAQVALLPYNDDMVKIEGSITARLTGETTVKKVKKKADSILKKGDELNTLKWKELCTDDKGNLLPEGTEIVAKLKRDGQEIEVKFPLKYGSGKKKHHFDLALELTDEQQTSRNIWLGK
jgi:predicted metalloprotease with PDZ domain